MTSFLKLPRLLLQLPLDVDGADGHDQPDVQDHPDDVDGADDHDHPDVQDHPDAKDEGCSWTGPRKVFTYHTATIKKSWGWVNGIGSRAEKPSTFVFSRLYPGQDSSVGSISAWYR